jgi:hypothetical protein
VTDESRPWLLRRWSRRATTWAAGAAALIAGGSAAAVVATSGSTPRHQPASSQSDAALATKDALDAILAHDPDVGQPVANLISQGKLPKATYAGDHGQVGVPAGVSHPTTAPGTVPSFIPGSLSGDFSLLEMASLALSQGCPASQAPIAAAIGAAESAGNPGAQGDVSLMDGTWDWSEGLWQIRGLKSERGTGGLRDSLANADPVRNAKAMMAISSGCLNWTPWSTYNTGAYLSYLSLSTTAAEAAAKYRQKTGSYPPVGTGDAATVPSPDPTTSTRSAGGHPGTKKSTASAAASRSPSPGARANSSTPAKSPTAHPASTPKSKSTTKAKALPTKAPTLPVKLPPIPVPTPTLPVKLPTSISVPPIPVPPVLP